MKSNVWLSAGVIAWLCGAAMASTDAQVGLMPTGVAPPTRVAANRFLSAHAGAAIYWTEQQPTTIYGRAFSHGDSPQASAQAFVVDNHVLLGVPVGQLSPGSLASDGAAVREIMPDPDTGAMKFTVVSYVQHLDGIPVYGAELKLLVRNEPGSPVVLARSSLRRLGDFRVNARRAADVNLGAAFAQAALRVPGISDWGTPELTVWAGVSGQEESPVLALKFTVAAGDPTVSGYDRRTIVADAATGRILHEVDEVHHVDVSGTVSGMATTGKKSAACSPEVKTPLPYVRVGIGSTFVFADAAGKFTVPNSGSTAVTVAAQCRGQYFRVYNPTLDAPGVSMSVTPPGPADLVFNASNTNAQRLAEVNAYLQANVARDYLLVYAPTHPVIPTQTEFRVNTGVAGTCNAFYDGNSINFFNAGGGCTNTAFGDVVWHEYGHHIVNTAGSGQGEYGEGFSDAFAMLISDEPVVGYGYALNCNQGVRTASNIFRYPCSDPDPHWCGQLLSGCFWETRNALFATDPSNYRAVISSLAINSVILRSAGDTSINPQITIDVLTLDDDNADIGDGTPHYAQIETGFGERHNMHAPPLTLLAFNIPEGLPEVVDPAGGPAFTVSVQPLHAAAQPESGVLMVDASGSGNFVPYPMTATGENEYLAVFPALPCGSHVQFYVTAMTTSGQTVQDARIGRAIAGADVTEQFADNFETDQGWTTSVNGATGGAWQRGVPAGGGYRGDPLTDFDGSGACFLTENVPGNSDVDGGSVMLISPTLDATEGEALLSYARWYDNTGSGTGDGAFNDVMTVDVSNDDGNTWVNLETVGPVQDAWGGWVQRTFKLSSVVALTSQMKVRFTASDLGAASIVEAAIDAVRLQVIRTCEWCPADFDHSGFVDLDDFSAFVPEFEAGSISADHDHSGFVDFDDFIAFVADFEAGC